MHQLPKTGPGPAGALTFAIQETAIMTLEPPQQEDALADLVRLRNERERIDEEERRLLEGAGEAVAIERYADDMLRAQREVRKHSAKIDELERELKHVRDVRASIVDSLRHARERYTKLGFHNPGWYVSLTKRGDIVPLKSRPESDEDPLVFAELFEREGAGGEEGDDAGT